MVGVSRLTAYGLASTTVTCLALVNAFRQRGNFYAATVYLAKSSGSLMILWNQAIYQTVILGKVLQAIFFGQLRMIELERLQERGWFAATETLLALTIFKEDFESTFVALCVGLLFLKVFHWLASDRVELMEQSANLSRAFHLRMVSLLGLLWLVDGALLLYSIESVLTEGPTVMILFASEYLILLAMVWSTTLRYGINCIDLRRDPLNPWENKSIYLFYVDLAADFFKLTTYLLFFFLILTFYGLPLNILRDVYITCRSFLGKLRDLRRYRQATSNMDSLYPDATKDEVERGDATCIICREEMEFRERAEGETRPAGLNETPKKLGCGHIFHFHCLRSWLERQQSCPTCRRPVLESDQQRPNAAAAAAPPPPPPPQPAAAPRPAQGDPVEQARVNLARNLGRQAFAVLFPGEDFPAEALEPTGRARTPPPAGPTPMPTTNGTTPPVSEAEARRERAREVNLATRYPNARLPPGTGPFSGSTTENPLAKFNLKSFPLPQAGERALYAPPPAQSPLNVDPQTVYVGTSDFANLAYGAYPRGLNRQGSGAGASKASADPLQSMNVEQRLDEVRKHLALRRTHDSSPQPATAEPPVVDPTAPTGEAEEKTPEQPDSIAVDPRQAARDAAERRAAAAAGRAALPSTTSNGQSPTEPEATASVPAEETAPPPVANGKVAQEAPKSTALPRLIPLGAPGEDLAALAKEFPQLLSSLPTGFSLNSASPLPSAALASRPFLAGSSTSSTTPQKRDVGTAADELDEADRLSRKMLEDRLRLVRSFQDRLEGLGREMSAALEGAPVARRRVDKGKGREVE